MTMCPLNELRYYSTRGRMHRLLLLLLPLLSVSVNSQSSTQEPVGYTFQYGVRDDVSGTLYAHTETRRGVTTTGQYTVHLPDGRVQTVKYTADHNGYRATVSYDGVARHPDRVIPSGQRNSKTRTFFPPVKGAHRVPSAVVAVPASGRGSRGQGTRGNTSINVPTVPPPPSPSSPTPQSPSSPFTVPHPLHQTSAHFTSPQSSLPSHHFTHSPSIHKDTRLPAIEKFVSQTNIISVPNTGDGKLPSKTNFNHFYHLPSSSRSKPSPNTYIPSSFVPEAPEPLNLVSNFNSIPMRNKQKLKPSLEDTDSNNFTPIFNHIEQSSTIPRVPQSSTVPRVPESSTVPRVPQSSTVPRVPESSTVPRVPESITQIMPPYYTVPDLIVQTGPNLPPTHLMPPYRGDHSGVTFLKLTPLLTIPSQQLQLKHKVPQSIELPKHVVTPAMLISQKNKKGSILNSFLPNSVSQTNNIKNKGSVNGGRISSTPSSKHDENTSDENIPTSRPTPQPVAIQSFQLQSLLLPPPPANSFSKHRAPPTMFLPLPSSEQHKQHFIRRPFIIDPDASVFHNQPSIIVDFKHRGTSHEDDSDGVSLTAPYVVVAGDYSPNPAAKFSVNSNEVNPNSVASHGIAPPDAAEAGNIRLSSGFLPPHLARLHLHDEIGSMAPPPTPTPVQIQLKLNENKKLPLRNIPSTFGGEEQKFSPNSLNLSKQLSRVKHTHSLFFSPNAVGKTAEATLSNISNTESSEMIQNPSDSSVSRIIDKTESRPLITNG